LEGLRNKLTKREEEKEGMGRYEKVEEVMHRLEIDPRDEKLRDMLLEELKRQGIDLEKHLRGKDFRVKHGLKSDAVELRIDYQEIEDFTFIYGMKELERIYITRCKIESLHFLRALKNVRLMSLISNFIVDITPISGLKSLRDLSIFTNLVVDVSPLSELADLRTLDLYQNRIVDISPLRGLTNLVSLHLAKNTIKDVSPLGSMTNLRYLNLSENEIEDITPLATITDLKDLYLSYNPVKSLLPLKTLTKLEGLELYELDVDIEELMELFKDMPELKNVYLGRTKKIRDHEILLLRQRFPYCAFY